ncbi:MAG: DinB family protein [Candidatus Thorarchaeota archaeon]
MAEKVTGRAGEVLRFGLGARNWLLNQVDRASECVSWTPPEGGRSPSEIVEHVTSVLLIACSMVAEELAIDLNIEEVESEGEPTEVLKDTVRSAYDAFNELCGKLDNQMLDKVMTLPPPFAFREGSVETVMRVIGGYHAVHHAGQLATHIRRSTKTQ